MQAVDLSGFHGTEHYYHHKLPMVHDLLLTDGTKYFAEKAGAYWFMDIVATEFMPLLSEEEYIIFIEVTVNDDNSAVIVGTDGDKGDGPITLHTRNIEYTDLPAPSEFKFILTVGNHVSGSGVLMLPSEY